MSEWFPHEELRTSHYGIPYYFYCNVGRDDDPESVPENQLWGISIETYNRPQFLLGTREQQVKLIPAFSFIRKLQLYEMLQDNHIFVSSNNAFLYEKLQSDAQLRQSARNILQLGVSLVISLPGRLVAEMGERLSWFASLSILRSPHQNLLPRQKILNALVERLVQMNNLLPEVTP